MKVRILKKDIQSGAVCSVRGCPVARALRRAGFKRAMVFGGGFSNDGTARPLARLPDRVNRFIDRFDDGKPVKPFTFTLPDSILKSR